MRLTRSDLSINAALLRELQSPLMKLLKGQPVKALTPAFPAAARGAATGQVAAVLPSRVMNSRRLLSNMGISSPAQ
jgi:hypothetical protein